MTSPEPYKRATCGQYKMTIAIPIPNKTENHNDDSERKIYTFYHKESMFAALFCYSFRTDTPNTQYTSINVRISRFARLNYGNVAFVSQLRTTHSKSYSHSAQTAHNCSHPCRKREREKSIVDTPPPRIKSELRRSKSMQSYIFSSTTSIRFKS